MIATGLATGKTADPALAAQAVTQAMTRLNISHATSVLLFLSDAFAHDPRPALLAASRQSQCMQVTGCSATGIFTEETWVLDAPAAAAMVFSDPQKLVPSHASNDLLLTLAAPNAIQKLGMSITSQYFGGISGDATGYGSHKVWQNGKVCTAGHSEMRIEACTGRMGVSRGIRALTPPAAITGIHGYELSGLNGKPALHTLLRELPLEAREFDHIPLHRLMAAEIQGEPENAIAEGRYRLIPIIATHSETASVTLASQLPLGSRLFWALRQPLAAESGMRSAINQVGSQLAHAPDFGIMVSSSGRGPGFYNGDDRDLRIMKQCHPNMPFIGFYGNGEITCIDNVHQLLDYSCVFGLFHYNISPD